MGSSSPRASRRSSPGWVTSDTPYWRAQGAEEQIPSQDWRRCRTTNDGCRMSHRDLALDFLRRFAGGDVDGLEPLLAEDLRLNGPNLELESRTAYLEALRPPPPRSVQGSSVERDGRRRYGDRVLRT
jgi:hypothetical protein